MALSVVGFFIITHWLLALEDVPGAAFKFFLCGIVGMACAYVIVLSTQVSLEASVPFFLLHLAVSSTVSLLFRQYYTDYAYAPVQSIAEASNTGHGTNIIIGISVGMKATMIPTLTVAVAVLTAYHLGSSTGIGSGRNAGLFGTGIATMGMLSNAVYILSMNNYGPVAVSI